MCEKSMKELGSPVVLEYAENSVLHGPYFGGASGAVEFIFAREGRGFSVLFRGVRHFVWENCFIASQVADPLYVQWGQAFVESARVSKNSGLFCFEVFLWDFGKAEVLAMFMEVRSPIDQSAVASSWLASDLRSRTARPV